MANSIWDETGWEDYEELSEEDVIIDDDEALPVQDNEEEEELDINWFNSLMEDAPEETEVEASMKSDPYLSSWIPSKSTPKVNVTDNAKYAYNYLNEKGLPSHVSAGIVGNLMKESNVNPNTRDGDKRGGIGGIAQLDPTRSRALINFSKQQGRNAQDLDTQLDFVMHEAKQRGDLDKTMSAKTPEEAAVLFGRSYERPSEKYADWNTRQANARKIMSKQYGGYTKALYGIDNIPEIEEFTDDYGMVGPEGYEGAENFEDVEDDSEDPSNINPKGVANTASAIVGGVEKTLDGIDKVKSFRDRIGNNISKGVSSLIDLQNEVQGTQRNALSLRKFNERKNRKKYANVSTSLNQPLIYT